MAAARQHDAAEDQDRSDCVMNAGRSSRNNRVSGPEQRCQRRQQVRLAAQPNDHRRTSVNVIAAADCGFSSQALYKTEVHHTVVWEKFKALRQGADLATEQLWSTRAA